MREGEPRRRGRPNKGYVATTLSLHPDVVKAARVYAAVQDKNVTLSDIANEAIARFIVGDLQNKGTIEEVEATVQRIIGRNQVNPQTLEP